MRDLFVDWLAKWSKHILRMIENKITKWKQDLIFKHNTQFRLDLVERGYFCCQIKASHIGGFKLITNQQLVTVGAGAQHFSIQFSNIKFLKINFQFFKTFKEFCCRPRFFSEQTSHFYLYFLFIYYYYVFYASTFLIPQFLFNFVEGVIFGPNRIFTYGRI